MSVTTRERLADVFVVDELTLVAVSESGLRNQFGASPVEAAMLVDALHLHRLRRLGEATSRSAGGDAGET
jgi:hypothetical protein